MKRIVIHKDGHDHAAHAESYDHAGHADNTNSVCKEARYWENPGYHRYIKAHGEHFSRKLSVWACAKMQNRNGMVHTWSPEQVEAALQKMGYNVDPKQKYDAHYLANMAYADLIGSSIKDETDCLQYAIDFLSDPDGYKEKAFNNWLTDAMKKCWNIDWDNVI